MADAITAFNEFASGWSATMLAILWQSSLLAAVVAGLLLAMRRLPPAARCWIWRIVAIKLLLMPFWTVNVPMPDWFARSSAPVPLTDPSVAATNTTPVEDLPVEAANPPFAAPQIAAAEASVALTWQAWLVVGWLAVIAIQLARLAWQRAGLSRLLADAQPADSAVTQLVAACTEQLRLTRAPQTLVTDVEVSPFICGMSRPILVLPASLASQTSHSRLRQIILHELAHVRRHDLVWCWLTHTMRIVYWFHPVAYWIGFREELERELACDQLAMSHSGASAADYAQTLVEAASRAAQPAVLRASAVAHLDGGKPHG